MNFTVVTLFIFIILHLHQLSVGVALVNLHHQALPPTLQCLHSPRSPHLFRTIKHCHSLASQPCPARGAPLWSPWIPGDKAQATSLNVSTPCPLRPLLPLLGGHLASQFPLLFPSVRQPVRAGNTQIKGRGGTAPSPDQGPPRGRVCRRSASETQVRDLCGGLGLARNRSSRSRCGKYNARRLLSPRPLLTWSHLVPCR